MESAVYFAAALALAIIIAVMLLAPSSGREKYGPPPGMLRAISHEELPDSRGWPGFDKVYEGSSASSVSHMMDWINT